MKKFNIKKFTKRNKATFPNGYTKHKKKYKLNVSNTLSVVGATVFVGGIIGTGAIINHNAHKVPKAVVTADIPQRAVYVETPKIHISSTAIPNTITTTTTTHTTTTTTNPAIQQLDNNVSETYTTEYTDDYYSYSPYDKIDYYYHKINANKSYEVSYDLISYVCDMAYKMNIPETFALAVCEIESGFIPNSNNATYDNNGNVIDTLNADGTIDFGLMGLNSMYLSDFCDTYNNGNRIDVYNGYENAYIGICLLAEHLNYYNGSIYDAACSYNLGIGGWDNFGSNSWYYGDKVCEYIDYLNN